ncbi:hypothetical protein RRG08_063628 [Elysia crispata]|uniref:Uncharacterized protein n=1 Tax=Elysia crispata TaxID=231223 RepID=A0AAE1AI65_9GAST|nr:hypothetical protein RRG08_063628 [Elysia crispata]
MPKFDCACCQDRPVENCASRSDWISEWDRKDLGTAALVPLVAQDLTGYLDSALASVRRTGDDRRWVALSVDPLFLRSGPALDIWTPETCLGSAWGPGPAGP